MGYGATFGILGGGMAPLPPPPKSAYDFTKNYTLLLVAQRKPSLL